MNPLFSEAANTVQGGWMMGVMTALFLVFFIGWVVWAYHPGRKAEMDEASMMPFSEGGES